MANLLTTQHARNLLKELQDRCDHWEPGALESKHHAMVAMGSQTDIAAGGVVDILGNTASFGDEATKLSFMDSFMLVILATMMVEQIERNITTVPNASHDAVQALRKASQALKGTSYALQAQGPSSHLMDCLLSFSAW